MSPSFALASQTKIDLRKFVPVKVIAAKVAAKTVVIARAAGNGVCKGSKVVGKGLWTGTKFTGKTLFNGTKMLVVDPIVGVTKFTVNNFSAGYKWTMALALKSSGALTAVGTLFTLTITSAALIALFGLAFSGQRLPNAKGAFGEGFSIFNMGADYIVDSRIGKKLKLSKPVQVNEHSGSEFPEGKFYATTEGSSRKYTSNYGSTVENSFMAFGENDNGSSSKRESLKEKQ